METFKYELIWNNVFFRLRFSAMETFVVTHDLVMHMEIDVQGKSTASDTTLLFAKLFSLWSATRVKVQLIVGTEKEAGYKEGTRESARFDTTSSLVQLNKTTVVVVDSVNHCLRIVDRSTSTTTPFMGVCETSGTPDDSPVKFNFPENIIYNNKTNSLLLTEALTSDKICSIDLETTNKVTLYKSDKLRYPNFMVYDNLQKNVFISNKNFIAQVSIESKTVAGIIGNNSPSFNDGPLSTSKFSWPQ